MENLKDKYFINRQGFDNATPKEKCKTIYDYLGFITINITKKNKKSFRCDYSNALYKEIGIKWYEYDELELHKQALNLIAKNLYSSFYSDIGKITFNMLSEVDKIKVEQIIQNIALKKAMQTYKYEISLVNKRLSEKDTYIVKEVIKTYKNIKVYNKKN